MAAVTDPFATAPMKFVAPRPRAEHLVRERQLALIDPDARLLLVCAPAGYGKSTLVAQWMTSERARKTAWVQLACEDNQVFAFWIAIASALANLEPSIGSRSLGALAGPVADMRTMVLGPLIDDIGAAGPLGLVLDDLHLITDEACHATLERFVERAPANLTVAIATRSEPPFALGRLRARGQLTELRGDDLRFDAREIEAFLNVQLKLGLGGGDLAALAARTEGWPAGLYLAALSLRGIEDRHDFVATFAGDDRLIVDYLGPEILRGLDETVRSFLCRIAILERFCAPLCAAVTGEERAAELLAELARSNLFLVSLDRRRYWYRYHHLFRDLLSAELQRGDPQAIAELHRRAAAWHRAQGDVVEAIGHDIAAGDREAAAGHIAAAWPELLSSRHWPTVASWTSQLPEHEVIHVRGFAVFKAWLGGGMHARDEVARLSALAREFDDGRPLPDGSTSTESSLALIDAIYIHGDVARARAAALRAAALERSERHAVMVPVVLSYTGFWTPIDEAQTREAFARADRAWAQRGSDSSVVGPGHAHLAFLDLLHGNLDDARRNVARALEVAEQAGVSEHAASCITRTALGWLMLAEGRPAEAEAELLRALQLARQFREPIHVGNALRVVAECRHALGDDAGAAAYLAEAQSVVDACADPGFLRHLVERSARNVGGPARPPAAAAGANAGGEPLSERELEVLALLAGPLSLAQISERLFVSHNTVKTHCKSIYRKLDVNGRAEAVRRARDRDRR